MALDTWTLVETEFTEEHLARSESLFSIGNGYVGFRGFPCDREPAQHSGVFINGFYELSPIHYGEDAYGFARYNQTMLDLPDCRFLWIEIDGQRISVADEAVQSYRKELDFRNGLLTQKITWRSQDDILVDICWESFISMAKRHLGALHLTITASAPIDIALYSSIAMPVPRAMSALDPRVGTVLTKPSLACVGNGYSSEGEQQLPSFHASFKTVESGLHLSCGAVHKITVPVHIERFTHSPQDMPGLHFTHHGSSLELFKCFYYHTSGRPGEQLPLNQVSENRIDACALDWDQLLGEQCSCFEDFWAHADVQIVGDEKLQQALRLNLFQLYQSTGADGMSSLAAKGLTGSGYEGHYFWDTEIYGMPFFNHTQAKTARALIAYRISTLDYARERARQMSQKGALFPWRTINGLEASAYFPAGTAQYHINADIAYSIFQYLEVSGDDTILAEGAADILLETARLFYDLGFFNPAKDGLFCINEVTGPDEYSALVDNNTYTNIMVKHHFEGVVALFGRLKRDQIELYTTLERRLHIAEEELENFAEAARLMYIPFDGQRGINPQDDYFLNKEPWDTDKRGELFHPLLLNYHPLVIYRHRLLKQADTVLAMLLQHHRFPWYLRRRNFFFYEPLTTGDSSLSACIQGIQAFDAGEVSMGIDYIRQTALMDIDDLHRNTKDGLHTAAMAGSWMAMVYGIAGYRMHEAVPTFCPQMPEDWHKLAFHLTFGKIMLTVTIDSEYTTYVTKGGELTIGHRSDRFAVGEKPVRLSTKPHCKAVIFDLDGVVTSTDGYHYRAWKRLSDEQGWKFDETVNQKLRGISRRQSLQVILDHNGVALDDAEMDRLTTVKNDWYRQSLQELTPSDILDGIRELLVAIKQRGLQTAIASASRNAPFILDRLDLTDSFDVIVPAPNVVCGKPDPEVFARAADMLGVFPEECCAIEDAPAGIEAIRAAKMRSIGVGSAINPDCCSVHVPDTSHLMVDLLVF
ncbi:beta-phosphoglucomutase [Pleomorphochaeta sp. DL1XJH-081]|uniref:beta-phosphoglucomutase n=1 Tax=Pleomorphochaeta sp. DL1XJH-081 TaxID=3409690 RepID=UPI003BB7D34D